MCAELQGIEHKARGGRLTHENCRRVIESVVNEIMAESGVPLQRKTVREHFTFWLSAFERERSEGTFIRYQGIVGHESEAVSRNYTHIDAETKRAAMAKLPNVTK